MKKTIQLALMLIAALSCCRFAVAQSDLNQVKVGSCGTEAQVKGLIAAEGSRSFVIDTRPFAINQTTGKALFSHGDAHVAVVHMNPFVYDYRITVAQQEMVNTAVTDFVKLLFPKTLTDFLGLQSGTALTASHANDDNKLRLMEQRLSTLSTLAPASCTGHDQPSRAACDATVEMYRIFLKIRDSIDPSSASVSPMFATLNNGYLNVSGVSQNADDLFVAYTKDVVDLRNEQLETHQTCTHATNLNIALSTYDFAGYFDSLDKAEKEINRITSLTDDLEQLANDYNTDEVLKDKDNIVRCAGFNCANQFKAYAAAVRALIGGAGYSKRLNDLRTNGRDMKNMFARTEQMKTKDGLFARTFDVPKKFELSEATISVKREKLEDKNKGNSASGSQSGNAGGAATNGIPPAALTGGSSSEGSVGESGNSGVPQSGTPDSSSGKGEDGGGGGGSDGGDGGGNSNGSAGTAGQINETVQLGRPRFMLSGGLVYSPLARRTFEKVQGFVLDAQGNPTGKGDAEVIGLGQNSPRRLLPMLLLNSRLFDYGRGSVFLSFGITAKKDDNVDLEYLIGPSFSFLNDRALFTFGAYGGLTQNLVGDLKLGQEIPDDVGDAKFFTKHLVWKPGFSFSYSFSKNKRASVADNGGKPSASDELKNEIRIGGVPFNLAIGFAYTSLEQRTYDEIVGFARDRQGNLTNGQNLARIVGVTSSSSYRLTPVAMLHTRLTNLGAHDFYFTTGITGKKTDNDLDVEYLLGGSINMYRRKVFLTVGTFVGKQQILGGNFFEGAALGKSQSVTTTDRYVWKPAFSFSYDISKIIPR